MCVCVVAGCAPCRVTPLTLGVTLQRSAAPPFPSGPCVPPGAPYQNTLGAVPQDPLTLKLRLDTNDVNIVRTAPQICSQGACGAFYLGLLQTDSRKSRCRDYGLDKQLFVQTAPPPQRGRGRGCGAERRQWRMQRGGAPAAVEKIEQASSAKIFSSTARRWGRCARCTL